MIAEKRDKCDMIAEERKGRVFAEDEEEDRQFLQIQFIDKPSRGRGRGRGNDTSKPKKQRKPKNFISSDISASTDSDYEGKPVRKTSTTKTSATTTLMQR